MAMAALMPAFGVVGRLKRITEKGLFFLVYIFVR
jgi:hypothetical protein